MKSNGADIRIIILGKNTEGRTFDRLNAIHYLYKEINCH